MMKKILILAVLVLSSKAWSQTITPVTWQLNESSYTITVSFAGSPASVVWNLLTLSRSGGGLYVPEAHGFTDALIGSNFRCLNGKAPECIFEITPSGLITANRALHSQMSMTGIMTWKMSSDRDMQVILGGTSVQDRKAIDTLIKYLDEANLDSSGKIKTGKNIICDLNQHTCTFTISDDGTAGVD